jgi:hypothetical protein
MSNKNPVTKWEKGQSGNPNGRPKKGTTFTDIIKEYMDEVSGEDRKTNKERLINKLLCLLRVLKCKSRGMNPTL